MTFEFKRVSVRQSHKTTLEPAACTTKPLVGCTQIGTLGDAPTTVSNRNSSVFGISFKHVYTVVPRL